VISQHGLVDTQSRPTRDPSQDKPRKAKIMTMSDLINAQNTPQTNWYTCWMSLGADGTLDNLIKEGLMHPDHIKISFEKGAEEIKEHVVPDQA
jgi:hypothetical protein